ncbi:MAG: sugar phosphate isomerase/epimerase [Desulfobacteraceae bacterium]|nr:sugar phosphate isomerase/epimerase [Desulfobacteraceae bacterium]
MKFAFSSNAFLRYSLQETIAILSDIGYEGIEIMADVPHAYPRDFTGANIVETRDLLARRGMRISNVNAFMHHADGDTYHPSWIEKDERERRRRIDYTLNCIDLAGALGAPHISTEPGGPLEGISREEGLSYFLDGLGAVEDRARAKGVKILIEPEPGLLIEKSSEFLELFSNLDPEVFGLNFDIGHFYCVGEDPATLVGSFSECAAHFHLEDIAASRRHHHLMPGEGAIDLPGVLDAIRRNGFDGFVTVELYTYEDRAEEAARKAFEYLAGWRESRCGA